jgi:hypothetical protein
MKKQRLKREKTSFKTIKIMLTLVIYPRNTRDTAVWVRGMPRCGEIHYRTRTRKTHDLKPAGFPVPVTIPINP